MDNELNVSDLTPIVIPFQFNGVNYELHEASEEASRSHANAVLTRLKKDENGNVISADTMADVTSILVAGCLFKIQDDGKLIPVPAKEVLALPRRLTKRLYKKIKEISELDETRGTLDELAEMRDKINKQIASLEGGEDALKNEQSDTTTGSE